ncbi:MAG: hypothetical protein ACOYM3_01105 [Terrimicrobiaceae bacterium]
MRTVDAAITAAELQPARKDRYSLIVEDNLLRFAAWTTQTNALLDTAIPQTYNLDAYAGTCVAWRTTDGKGWFWYLSPGTAASWALSTGCQIDGAGAATQFHCMRYGLYYALNYKIVAPLHNGSGIQLYQGAVKDEVEPATTFGPLFGPAFVETSAKVTRVEAVCIPVTGTMVVAVGTHDFTNGFSTIQFWVVTAGATTKLDTIIQMPLTEAYGGHWYSNAKYAALISAVYNSTTGAVWVFANAHSGGKAVYFSIINGIESQILPVVPLDPVYGSVTFRAATVCAIGGLYYLTGRISYAWADGTATAFDCYLTSSDCSLWSIGERNYYLHNSDSMGSLVVVAGSPAYIYYGGNLIVSRALATPIQGYNTSTKQLDVTAKTQQWGLSQGTNAPDKLSVTLINHDGSLTSSLVKRGALLRLKAGQDATLSDIGVYDLDTPETGVTPTGHTPMRIGARDAGSKAITRHNLPIDLDFWGQDVITSQLENTDGLVIKTNEKDVLTADPLAPPSDALASEYDVVLRPATFDPTTTGLHSKALNNPFVAYADSVDSKDALIKATVTMPDTGDLYALPAFGFVFGGNDTQFNLVAIPKNASWKAKAKPRVLKSALTVFDPVANTGGFNLESRYTGLWDSDGGAPIITTDIEAGGSTHYTTNTAFTHGAGETRDYALLLSGRRMMLYHKLHGYAAATLASRAGYTLILDYLCDDNALMYPAGKTRPGFVVSTDTWADKAAFAHAAYQDVEVGLTAAIDYASAAYYATSAVPAGGTGYTKTNTANYTLYNGGSVAAVDLRNYLYVGQNIRVNGVFRTISSFVTNAGSYNTIVTNSDAGSITNAVIYIRSGDYWAQASSAATLTSIGADSLWLDPKPVRAITTMTGYAAFMGNDPAALVYTPRWVDSDGVTHLLLDGAWDGTNPKTTPSAWKMVLHHNVIGKWRASVDKGLATSGRMLVGNEIVRYLETSITLWRENLANPGYANTQWLTYIPTYYAMPKTQTTPSTTIENFTVGGTDDLSGIPDAAGLLCEITGRSGGGTTNTLPIVYVVSAGATGGRGHVVIDTLPAGPILSSDFVIVSGRGQLGTAKTTHPSDAAVCYYPAPITATSAIDSLVTVSRFDVYSGRRASVEDAIAYLCAMAGMRAPSFRNYMTGSYATAAYPLTLTTTPQALPVAANVADFVLDCYVHIGTGGKLQIDFRSADGVNAYYRLVLKETATGKVTIGLQAIGSAITAGGLDTLKWLEYAEVPLSASVINATNADNAHVKLSAQNNLVNVEINGAPAWTFNLDHYTHTDGTSYKINGAFGILVSYSAAYAGNACAFRVIELWNEVKSITAQMGANTSSLLSTLMKKYYIRSRVTQSGGIEFTQFTTRDAAGTLQQQLKAHNKNADDARVTGHLQVTGKQPGAYMDTAYIAQDGYSFGMASNNDLQTVQEAKTDAALRVAEAEQFALQETVQATARIADQPEDTKVITYAPGGDAPAQAAVTSIITSIDWSTSPGGLLMANYKLRGES